MVERPDNMTGDLYKLLKSQDLGYVQTVVSAEEKVRRLVSVRRWHTVRPGV